MLAERDERNGDPDHRRSHGGVRQDIPRVGERRHKGKTDEWRHHEHARADCQQRQHPRHDAVHDDGPNPHTSLRPQPAGAV